MMTFLHEFLHSVRADNFLGPSMQTVKRIGVSLLSKAHI
jgi:hypothetical protein